MDNHDSRTAHPLEASTDERASSSRTDWAAGERHFAGAPRDSHFHAPPHPGEAPPDAKVTVPSEGTVPSEPPLLSDTLADTLAESIAETVDDTFPPGGRKPRHDGFTPERVGEFLRRLAATGVVEHAAAAVGVSATAAYNFRNRRQGRAFAKMWDAILINRARDRLASELQSRAVAGCVSVRKRDGVVVSEYHYYDNRLAMSLLTRLDRLAEKEAASEAHLRALSEDMEEYIDCVAEGADVDAFVEARRPAEPEPQPSPAGATAAAARAARPRDDDPELTAFARWSGCDDYRDVHPLAIPVGDIDADNPRDWDPDQQVRAWRSGFMVWQEGRGGGNARARGRGEPVRYDVLRRAQRAEGRLVEAGAPVPVRGEPIRTDDLDPDELAVWDDDQLLRAWRSGLLAGLPPSFWEALAEEWHGPGEAE